MRTSIGQDHEKTTLWRIIDNSSSFNLAVIKLFTCQSVHLAGTYPSVFIFPSIIA
jgi:hypothetical protein